MATNPPEQAGDPLSLSDFHCVARDGFGEPSVRIAQAMAYFRGGVYVGTGGRSLNPLGLGSAQMARLGVFGDILKQMDARKEHKPVGARIWRFDLATEEWSNVYTSPEVEGSDGTAVPRDRNVRASVVHATEDGRLALYFGISAMEGPVRIIRSFDGHTFEDVGAPGLGLVDADIPSIRNLCELHGRIYTSPVGKAMGKGMLEDNMTDFPMVFECADLETGNWRPVSAPGFGDPNNLSVNEIAVFDNHLYATTLNIQEGFQLWKSDCRGEPPYRWHKIMEKGAYRGPACSIGASLFPFKDWLYVGAGLQRQGKEGMDRYGPIAGELLRVDGDDEWEIVTGRTRVTPAGLKRPISGMGACFGDLFNRGVWCMQEHDGWLYAGTGDWRIFNTIIPGPDSHRSAAYRTRMQQAVAGYGGGFGLWMSGDGVEWMPVTLDGFEHNPAIYGIRVLTSTPLGMFVGTAGKGGIGGGLQVWRGLTEAESAQRPEVGS